MNVAKFRNYLSFKSVSTHNEIVVLENFSPTSLAYGRK